MNDNLREELRSEIEDFRTQTKRFLDKELNVKEFKGYSGGFGSYAQRGATSFMLRLRMNQGVMTKEKLKFVCDTCRQHNVSKAHITTCQTIQLHDLSGMEIPYIMSDALDHGIVCRGGGGDFPRNVMCSPLSGVDPEETFDVLPYAARVGEYLLSIVNKYTLPRKLKVAFTNSDRNEAHATFRDLGFIANRDHTFAVYCAGGLGNNPRMGVCVEEHAAPEKLLYYVSTMVLMFMEFGNYENRAKARTRYMQETLGSEGFVKAYQERLQRSLAGQNLDIAIREETICKTGPDEAIHDRRIFSQKQKGLYAVSYHPIGGSLTPQKLQEIYDCIQDMEAVEVRLTPQQGMYIINCTAQEAERVLSVTNDGARNEFEESTACIGAATCQVGLRDSQGVLKDVIMYLREKNYPDHVLPRVFISGCPSSCGTNQIGQLGFQGTVKVIERKPYPAFTLSVSGNDRLLQERFGDIKGVILEDDMCLFLSAIADAVTAAHTDFATWLAKEKEQLDAILHTYLK